MGRSRSNAPTHAARPAPADAERPAGAVVTKDAPAGAVVGGNPARLLNWRVPPADDLPGRLAAFADRARADAESVLARAWDASSARFTDRPGAEPTLRAQCDAVEIADLLHGGVPASRMRRRCAGSSTAGRATTAPTPPTACCARATPSTCSMRAFTAPPPLDDDATLLARLNALPWTDDAWHAGHVVDSFGTALLWRRRAGATVPDGYDEALFGWLVTHVDPATGVWGTGARETGMLLPVNGFYRATRGTSLSSACPCRTRGGSSTRCSRTPPTSGTSPRTVRTRATCSMSPTRCG